MEAQLDAMDAVDPVPPVHAEGATEAGGLGSLRVRLPNGEEALLSQLVRDKLARGGNLKFGELTEVEKELVTDSAMIDAGMTPTPKADKFAWLAELNRRAKERALPPTVAELNERARADRFARLATEIERTRERQARAVGGFSIDGALGKASDPELPTFRASFQPLTDGEVKTISPQITTAEQVAVEEMQGRLRAEIKRRAQEIVSGGEQFWKSKELRQREQREAIDNLYAFMRAAQAEPEDAFREALERQSLERQRLKFLEGQDEARREALWRATLAKEDKPS